jgi:GIY-YIG catalytic domain
MKDNIQDKIVKFIADKGEDGASSADLARTFLAPASAPEALCEKLIANVLESEARVSQNADGQWIAARSGGEAALGGEFTVVESVDVAAGGGRLPVEWAAVRIDARGKIVEGKEGIICPAKWPNDAIAPDHLKGKIEGAATSRVALNKAAELASGTTLVSVRPGPFQEHLLKAMRLDNDGTQHLFVGRLAKQILSREIKSIQDLAGHFGVPVRDPETAAERAAFVAELFCAMLARREELNLGEPDDWAERQTPKRIDMDFSRYDFDRAALDALPETPGIYMMRDGNGAILYVGKAVNLRRRVGDYFRARVQTDEKTQRIQEAVYSFDVEETGSELAALLYEYQLIQEHQPPVNSQFDVHDRLAAQRAPSRRWVVVLPAVDAEEAEVFMFYGNRNLMRAVIPREAPEVIGEELADFFFGPQPPEEAGEEELGWLRIAWSWLQKNRDRAHTIDVEMAAGLDETMRLLSNMLKEGHDGERIIHV